MAKVKNATYSVTFKLILPEAVLPDKIKLSDIKTQVLFVLGDFFPDGTIKGLKVTKDV